MTQSTLDDYQDSGCIDHTDPETLRRLYWDEGLSTKEIAELSSVTSGAITGQMERNGIERRSLSESLTQDHAGFETSSQGYERWMGYNGNNVVRVHRLLAVVEYGFDAVSDKHIHHKNGIPWDNRVENLEPLEPAEHQRKHNDGEKSPNAKLTRSEAIQVKELAKSGEKTHQQIADEYDISRSLVTMVKNGDRWPSLE